MNSQLKKLLLHPRTKRRLVLYLDKPAQGLLITGPAGSGKGALAQALAVELLQLKSELELEKYPYLFKLEPPTGKQEIAIDSVRQLHKDLSLKSDNSKSISRLVLILDANLLSREAQNALLKMLEEPAKDVVYVLTAVLRHDLLPTIVSRTQMLEVQPVSLSAAQKFYQSQSQAKSIESAWLLSGGSAGLLNALLSEESTHPLKQAVDQAKNWLTGDKYARQLELDSLSQNKRELALFLDGLSRLLRALQHQQLSKNQIAQSQRVGDSRSIISSVQKALEANAAPKLAAQHLLLNLRV